MPRERAVAGEEAAYGPRHPIASLARKWFHGGFRRLARPESSARIDAVVFEPSVRDAAELADLAARINWYLRDVRVPIYLRGANAIAFGPEDAPHMDPALVHARDITDGPPQTGSRTRHALHRISPQSIVAALPHIRSVTTADPNFSYASDHGYYRLHDALRRTEPPAPLDTVHRLLERRVRGGRAIVMGTGPSAGEIDPHDVDADIRIVCNSAVRNHEFIQAIRPDVICFADPVFHMGPSRYAAAFRADLIRCAETTTALIAVPARYVGVLLAHHPELRDRLVSLDDTASDWCWPSETRAQVRLSGNVLTYLMLPIAFALVDEVDVAGCDGRLPTEKYFWNHNPAVQYSSELMRDVFAAHPAFFRTRDYADYYAHHVRYLEEFIQLGEAAGKRVRGVTRSHIPALTARGAPRFE